MKNILNRLNAHQYLTSNEATTILTNIGNGKYNHEQIAAFISVFLMRSITIDEIMGFRKALLNLCHKVDLHEYNPIDIVGTGGDGKNTFNISTCSCFVLAGAGYNVCKHGNYGATSISGASNVVEQHGVKFTTDMNILKKSMDETHIAYLHAQLFNPAMKTVAPVRKALGVKTFFNLLGPLVNPCNPKRQCLGVYNLKMSRLYEYIYQKMNVDFAIVHSLDGYDELSLTGDMKVVTNEGNKIMTAANFGFKEVKGGALSGGNTVEEAAIIFDNVLNNTATEDQKHTVIANSAISIQTICKNKSLEDCIGEATISIESGKAMSNFKKFVEINS